MSVSLNKPFICINVRLHSKRNKRQWRCKRMRPIIGASYIHCNCLKKKTERKAAKINRKSIENRIEIEKKSKVFCKNAQLVKCCHWVLRTRWNHSFPMPNTRIEWMKRCIFEWSKTRPKKTANKTKPKKKKIITSTKCKKCCLFIWNIKQNASQKWRKTRQSVWKKHWPKTYMG